MRPNLVIVTTAAVSTDVLLRGQLSYLMGWFNVTVITSPGPQIPAVRAREGIQIFCVNMRRSPSPIRDAISLLRLTLLLRRLKPDIVHAYTPKAGLLGLLAAKAAGVPIRVRSVNGLPLMEASGIQRKALVWLERLSFWAATDVLANSSGLRSFIKSELCHGEVGMIGNGSTNGVDTNHFRKSLAGPAANNTTRDRLGIARDALVVLFVGRIVRDKGVGELAGAFVSLRDLHPCATLLLVGTPEPANPIDQKTASLIADSPDIIETGWTDDVRTYLEIADLLVLPSYREGLPNVLLQGACYGLPMVATDIPGITDIITNMVDGVLVPPKNTKRLAEALQQLASSRELRERLGSCAQEHVVQRYEQSAHWAAIRAWYESRLSTAELRR